MCSLRREKLICSINLRWWPWQRSPWSIRSRNTLLILPTIIDKICLMIDLDGFGVSLYYWKKKKSFFLCVNKRVESWYLSGFNYYFQGGLSLHFARVVEVPYDSKRSWDSDNINSLRRSVKLQCYGSDIFILVNLQNDSTKWGWEAT